MCGRHLKNARRRVSASVKWAGRPQHILPLLLLLGLLLLLLKLVLLLLLLVESEPLEGSQPL